MIQSKDDEGDIWYNGEIKYVKNMLYQGDKSRFRCNYYGIGLYLR